MTKKSNNDAFRIDVNKVLKDKNPKLAKIIPRFLTNWLKRIIHQDDINYVINKHRDKFGLDFVDAVLDEFNIKMNVINEKNIPTQDGRYIFAANHPLGGLESLVMMKVIGRHFLNIRFLVNDILLNLKNFSPIFLPINKHGSQSKEAVRQIEEYYASDIQILSFPAGMVSRKIKGKIIDLEWKKSFIAKAKKHKRDICPIYIDGTNSNFFYNLANIRKKIGLKANIEMLYLPREMFKQKGKTITIYIGKPISYKKFDKEKNPAEWAQYVKDLVYNLSK